MTKKLMMMVAAVAAALGAWAETETFGGYTWTYRINGDTAEIYKGSSSPAISPSPTGAMTIPSTLGGKTVTSIGSYAFYDCSGLTSVTIPSSVTTIGDSAFSGCSGLTSVTIPGSVTSIGDGAFSGCSGLTSVTIPGSVTSIGDEAFDGCSGLTSVTIPDSVTVIEDGAFRYCTGLTNVVLSAKLKNLGYTSSKVEEPIGVFEGCSGLRSILLPNALERIGAASFSYCESLTSVTIPGSVTSIGGRAFWNCSGLMSVTIPDSVTSIGEWAFEDCSGLTSVTIGNSVMSIGYGAFVDCSGLTSLVFEGNAPSVGSYTFSGVNSGCVAYVHRGSTGWGVSIPGAWNGMRIEYAEDVSPDIWTVTFDANGGELADGDSSRQVKDGTSLGELPVPSRLDYTFLGWFTAAEGGEQISGLTAVTGNTTYYAHWTQNAPGSSSSVVTTVVQQVAAPYALTDVVADRAIAEVTVDADCAIDSFVLKDGEVYDSVLYVSNTADNSVKLTLPSGFIYKTYKGTKPLEIPAKSQCMLSITRVADKTFLVSREELEDVQ